MTRPDKKNHSPGCILIPHTGMCVVATEGLPDNLGIIAPYGQFAVVGSQVFFAKPTGDTEWDQIAAALRAAPGNVHMSHEYLWMSRKAMHITREELPASANPAEWVRQMRVVGRVAGTWRALDTPSS